LCTQQWHAQHFAFAGTAASDKSDEDLATEVEEQLLGNKDEEEAPEAPEATTVS